MLPITMYAGLFKKIGLVLVVIIGLLVVFSIGSTIDSFFNDKFNIETPKETIGRLKGNLTVLDATMKETVKKNVIIESVTDAKVAILQDYLKEKIVIIEDSDKATIAIKEIPKPMVIIEKVISKTIYPKEEPEVEIIPVSPNIDTNEEVLIVEVTGSVISPMGDTEIVEVVESEPIVKESYVIDKVSYEAYGRASMEVMLRSYNKAMGVDNV